MMRRLNNNRGFSMLEMVLALVMGALIVGATSTTLLDNVDSYTFIANRKSALGDARYAMNRISSEFLKMGSSSVASHITSIDAACLSAGGISFTDNTGAAAGFYVTTNGTGLGLYRGDCRDGVGDQLLVDDVTSFTLTYYDSTGATTATIDNITRIKFTLKTAPSRNEGNVVLTTTVTPRQLIGYTNYQ